MKKIISLLILCSAIAYGAEEIYPTVYSLPGVEGSIPIILYQHFNNSRLTVAKEKDGEIELNDDVPMTEFVNLIEYCSPRFYSSTSDRLFPDKVVVIVPEDDYKKCEKILKKRCGAGIKINVKIPEEVALLKREAKDLKREAEEKRKVFETIKKKALDKEVRAVRAVLDHIKTN